jgi:hypothetical protein
MVHFTPVLDISYMFSLWYRKLGIVEQVGFDLDFKMGVMQRSLGPMSGGSSPLRTPFVAAVIVLLLLWSLLSLDMSKVKSTVVCFISSLLEKYVLTLI